MDFQMLQKRIIWPIKCLQKVSMNIHNEDKYLKRHDLYRVIFVTLFRLRLSAFDPAGESSCSNKLQLCCLGEPWWD